MSVAEIESLLSVREAARALDCSEAWVRFAIRQGRVPVIRSALGFLIKPSDLELARPARPSWTAARQAT